MLPPKQELERALTKKDSTYDGVFYFGVKTTGIFCRPSCPSRPKLNNVEFFASVKECLFAGYRPCKRCHPLEANGVPPVWVTDLIKRVESSPSGQFKAADLRAIGITPERARRWFEQHYGMSFSAWCRSHRLTCAFTQIREGATLDDATFSSGYESHSGFREAFSKTFGKPPGRIPTAGQRIVTTMLESPLGPLMAAAHEKGVCLLEFTDRRMLETNLKILHQRFKCAVVPGKHPLLNQLRSELAEYFRGNRSTFDVAITQPGTPFQEKVWSELSRIPYGASISYDNLAKRIGQPTAKRAVARANGMNRICILIPCHRVIGKDGNLSGYGGGIWRKRLLLDLEQSTQNRANRTSR